MPDGEVLHVQGELLILAVGNGRQAGGGMRLCPYAGEWTQADNRIKPLASGVVHLTRSQCHAMQVSLYVRKGVKPRNLQPNCVRTVDTIQNKC